MQTGCSERRRKRYDRYVPYYYMSETLSSRREARDLLYKYFGQLELLELRFSEIRVNFPWRDAFTGKLTTQTSIAYEKACIIFQIAATHSSIASSQNRSDPEGLKRAFYYFRTCAGMLTYINDNFLHAPSTDLSREVIKFLVGIILAQATEVFFEKCTDEKKGNALVSKIASQAAFLYSGLNEEAKEFMGKGIFDRNWITVIQVRVVCLNMSDKSDRLSDQSEILHLPSSVLSLSGRQRCRKAWGRAGPSDSSRSCRERGQSYRILVRLSLCYADVSEPSSGRRPMSCRSHESAPRTMYGKEE